MKLARLWLVVGIVWLAAACNKPSEENCRKALVNMRHLLGTDKLSQVATSTEGEVRRCRGGSSAKSVDCAIKATTVDELRACKLIKVPENEPLAPAPAPK